jgi:predicted MFS family arabinose efflux permease
VRRLAQALREELLNRGVLIAYAVAICMTTAEGTLLLLYPPYLDGHGYALPAIGTLVSLLSVMRLASRLPVGAAYGAARAKRLLVVGLLALAVATGGFAIADGNLAVVVLLTVVHGFAFGSLGTLVLAAVIDMTGGRRAGAIMAWYTAALSTGYALGALAGGALGDALGIPMALAIAAALPALAVFAVLALPEFHGPPQNPIERGAGLRGFLGAAAHLDPRVWLAFVIVLYINLVSDAVDAFFPLFGLSIGLPLAAVGLLKGLKSASATVIRFASLVIARYVDYRTINFWGVLIMGLATLALPYVSAVAALAVLFVLLGFCRGILRVTSAATVAELRSEGKDVGIASGVYNAGLDIGAIIGPAIGGVLGNAFGLPAMFQIVAVASLALYFGVALSTDAGRASLAIRRPSLVWLRGRDQS